MGLSKIIELRNLRKSYVMGAERVVALDGVSLTIHQGEYLAITGPSGSGKSTMMHVIGLMDTADSGSYLLNGRETTGLSADELALYRRETVGFVFQQFHLLARTPAIENVVLPHLYSRRQRDFSRARALLTDVGLGERLHHMPSELSGGQQQRVAIARALMNDPQVLLADEPTGNLDSKSSEDLMALFDALNARGMTVILVTHDEAIAAHAKRIIRFHDGKVQSDESQGAGVDGPPSPSSAEGGRKPPGLWRAFGAHFLEGLKAINGNKVRSGLSLLGILIGVATVITMLAVGRGAREMVQKQLARMGSNRLELSSGIAKIAGVSQGAGSISRLTVDDAEAIRRTFSGVTRIAPEVDGRGQVSYRDKNWSTRIRATTPDHAPMHDLVPLVGRYFDDEENDKRARVVVIGQTIVNELFDDQDPIGEFIKVNKVIFQVVGILPERGDYNGNDRDDVIHVPLLTGMRRLLSKSYVDEINVEVADANEIESTQNELKELMIRRHHPPVSMQEPFRVRNLAEIQKVMSESNQTMTFLIAIVAFISLLVGGVGIMNIMLVSVTERTSEIGLRKALGARSVDILSQFLQEAVAISLVGGILGVLVGCAASTLFSTLAGWSIALSWDALVLATASAMSIGVVFGLWPARKAAALNPIEALRYQ